MPDTSFALPGSAGEYRDPYGIAMAQAQAALRKIQAEGDLVHQQSLNASPDYQRQQAFTTADQMGAAADNGTFDAADAYAAKRKSQVDLAPGRESQLEYEGDPRHLNAIEASGFSKLMPSIFKAQQTAAAGPKLLQQDKGMLESASMIGQLGGNLMDQYEKMYPGIGDDPKKFGGVTDMLPAQVLSGLYSAGMVGSSDRLIQDAETIKAWGVRAVSSGRMSAATWDRISQHLPGKGYSPGANYERMRNLLTDILPSLVNGVAAANKPFDVNDPFANMPSAIGGQQP